MNYEKEYENYKRADSEEVMPKSAEERSRYRLIEKLAKEVLE